MFDVARRERELNKWRQLLMAVDNPIRILIINEAEEIYPGRTHVFKRFYIQSTKEIMNILAGHGLSVHYGRPGLPEIEAVKGRKVAMDNGLFATFLAFYGFPRQVDTLLTPNILRNIDYLSILIKTVPPHKARKYINDYIERLRVLINSKAEKSVAYDIYMWEYQAAQTAQQLLYAGNNRLHEVSIVAGVFEKDPERLEKRVNDVRHIIEGLGIMVDRPYGGSQILLYRDMVPPVYMVTDGLTHFYPFQSADLIEAPGGIYLGVNKINGSPVVVNVELRPNYNIAIVGKSGSGKSMAIKIFLGRLLPTVQNPLVYIIDPENEYQYLGNYGFNVYRLEEGTPLGLDLIKSLPKTTVVQMLSELEELTPQQRRNLSVAVAKSQSTSEFFEKAREYDLQNLVQGLESGTYSWLFTGWEEDLEVGDMAVFSLGDMGKDAKEYVAGILLTYLWRRIDKAEKHRKKVIVIDEAWIFNRGWSAMVIEEMTRLGRKRNVTVITSTQFIEDVMEERYLRSAFQNSSLKFIFSHDRGSAEALAKLQIPEHLIDEIIHGLDQGDSLLMSESTMIWMHWLPTEEEYRVYTTKPTEV